MKIKKEFDNYLFDNLWLKIEKNDIIDIILE